MNPKHKFVDDVKRFRKTVDIKRPAIKKANVPSQEIKKPDLPPPPSKK